MTHEELFMEIPVGRTVARHWEKQSQVALDGAAKVISAHGANPWVFAADARHLIQFSGTAEVAALQAMTDDQREALLSYWTDPWYRDWIEEELFPGL